jgi:hypothetical protein
MSQVNVKWHEVDSIEDGHGVVFQYTGVPSIREWPVAFLPGFTWRDPGDNPVVVEMLLRPGPKCIGRPLRRGRIETA